MENVIIDPNRFVRVNVSDSYGTSHIKWRYRILEEGDLGDYLSRLWALYGAPDLEDKGFSYTLKDQETGFLFTAYSSSGGPSYGGFPETKKELLPVFEIFDELLSQIKPADCEIEFQSSFGSLRIGARDGVPYEKISRKRVSR